MKTLYTRASGLLAMKPERQEVAKQHGVVVLEFGAHMPPDGILLADARPRGFKGGRGPDDRAATAIYDGGPFASKKPRQFEDFDRALKAAIKMAHG